MLVTIFLGILIAALILGNIFLSIAKPKKIEEALLREIGSKENSRALLQQMQNNKNIAASNHLLQQGKIRPAFVSAEQPDFRQMAEMERARMLNKRVDRLENLLLKMNGAKFVSYKLNGANLEQKLSGLEEFRQNTSLEIAALKQQLAALKGNELPEENEEEIELSAADEKRAHAIVYHGNKS